MKKRIENILENLFVVVLAFYPLRHISWGLDFWDTGYNYANFRYMGTEHMDSMWLFSTYLSNAVGKLLTTLPNADHLLGMNLYTGLFVSLLVLTGYFFCSKVLKIPTWIVFVGEFAAASLCWCPTALLYNYLTYLLLSACVILLYLGLTREKRWYLFAAGACLGTNILVRFSNLPELGLILAVWAYDFILWREDGKAGTESREKQGFWPRLGHHTLWCVLGYLAALAVLFGYIHARYGLDQYAAGISRLFAMTDSATDYKAASMVLAIVRVYTENLYWAARLAAIAAGGTALFILAGWLRAETDRRVKRYDENRAKKLQIELRVLMGLLGVAAACFLQMLGFWPLLSQGELTVRQFGVLLPALAMAVAVVYCLGERVSAGLLGAVMLAWLYYREFCSLLFYSYDSMLRPGILFLMLTILIAVIRIFCPGSPKEEKLISGLLLLVVVLTSLGSNNNIYPSLNNLFLAAPYTFGQCWRFLCLARKGETATSFWISGKSRAREQSVGAFRLSLLPAKGVLAAFLVMCLIQFGGFGAYFVFAESTGIQNPDSFVENNKVLDGIRMSGDKARWMTEISDYVGDNGLTGQEVILYGRIPSMSFYLQMPSAFNPWSDLDSYSIGQMKLDLAQTAEEMGQAGIRPVILVHCDYAAYREGGRSALESLGVADGQIQKIEEDKKWALLEEFIEDYGYEPAFQNEKFVLYR